MTLTDGEKAVLVTEFLRAVESDFHYAEAIAKDAMILKTARAEGRAAVIWGRRNEALPRE